MNTRLIYVNKEKAQVKNDKDGSFFNNVDDGIVVKRGDEISIEQISIASKGVGSDIIEVPSTLQDYAYETNQQILNFMIYIHHNYQYTVQLPLSVQNTTWALPTGLTNDDSFGYLNQSGFPITLPMTTNCKSKAFQEDDSVMGDRYYLGRFTTPDTPLPDGVYIPKTVATADLYKFVPGPLVFNFLETEIQIGADTGYDNPSNIANKITQDLHASTVFLNQTTVGNQAQSSSSINNVILPDKFQLATSSFRSACVSINGIPDSHSNQNTRPFYTNYMGVKNPFKFFYGSRLLNGTITNKSNSLMESQAQGTADVLTNMCYWVNQPPRITSGANVYSKWDDGFVYFTNITYNADNMVLLSKHIKSQKWFNRTLLSPQNQDMLFETSDIDNNSILRKAFISTLNVGRMDDAFNGANPPVPPVQNPTQQGTARIEDVYCKTFYQEDYYNKRFLDTNSLQQSGAFIDDIAEVTLDGQQFNAKTLSQLLDVNLVAVNTGSLFGNNEIVIGIVMAKFSQSNTAGNIAINESEYGPIDLSFFRNPSVLVNNPDVADGGSDTTQGDYTGFMNIGSPEAQLLFDPTRGRFAFTNLAWANKISSGSGQTANPNAGINVISSNHDAGTTYASTKYTTPLFTKFAQSGLGLRNISVISKNNTKVEIDPYSDSDIQEKFHNSLLNRLGFKYKSLINLNGLPDVKFTNRNYDTIIPVENPNFFPYPLTTNLRFDTALSTSLSVNANGFPMYNLSAQRGVKNINVNSSPDLAFASNLPSKLVFPFWLIKTDIIDGIEFNTANNGQNQNIMAVCNRAYISGDFAFSFATSYNFKATREFSISGIKTSILNPDLSPADVDDGTTIIYKVVSPIPLFTQQALTQQAIDENRVDDKKKEKPEDKVDEKNEKKADDDDEKQKIEN